MRAFIVAASVAFFWAVPVAASAGEPTGRQTSFKAADGVTVFADYYTAERSQADVEAAAKPRRRIVLLFHQAGSNAAEYVPLVGLLTAQGFDCLAVDQRSGGYLWGRNNRTVAALGRSRTFIEAYPDLEAAVAWARGKGYGDKIVVWGSSYSAALVFRLASENVDIAAVLAFSPGEYVGEDNPVHAWAAEVAQPVFITSGPGSEATAADSVFDAVGSKNKTRYRARSGVHGSSTLREDRNAAGFEDNWDAVLVFLRAHAS